MSELFANLKKATQEAEETFLKNRRADYQMLIERQMRIRSLEAQLKKMQDAHHDLQTKLAITTQTIVNLKKEVTSLVSENAELKYENHFLKVQLDWEEPMVPMEDELEEGEIKE